MLPHCRLCYRLGPRLRPRHVRQDTAEGALRRGGPAGKPLFCAVLCCAVVCSQLDWFMACIAWHVSLAWECRGGKSGQCGMGGSSRLSGMTRADQRVNDQLSRLEGFDCCVSAHCTCCLGQRQLPAFALPPKSLPPTIPSAATCP